MTSYNGVILKYVSSLIESWNEKDLNKISNMLLDSVTLESPHVQDLFPEQNLNTLKGKNSVIAYWEKLLSLNPNLKVSVRNVKRRNKIIRFDTDFNSVMPKMETLIQVNEYGKIIKIKFEHPTEIGQSDNSIFE